MELESFFAWVLGTVIGCVAGDLMPSTVAGVLSIAMYGMFIAIVVPVARENRGVAPCAVAAAVLSCVFRYVPLFSGITSGFSVILCAVAAAALAALKKPVEVEK